MRVAILFCCLFLWEAGLFAQQCNTLGQTPATAFPVCGSTTFTQETVPYCSNNVVPIPGCGDGNTDKNPFYYKFTCYGSGSLAFEITPHERNEDYDWQLFDITGHNPNDIFTDKSLIVTGNWAGTYGVTGASNSGVNFIQCGSVPSDKKNTFSKMPFLVEHHVYLLMVSHFEDTPNGYDLNFSGGTAVITDPTIPAMSNAKADCDGEVITVRVNKKIKCSSLSSSGSEFLIPGGPAVLSAISDSCSSSFDFDELSITLTSRLANGTYDLLIMNGSDGNTLLDNCDQAITASRISFTYNSPVPIFADSIGSVGCAPTGLKVYFPKRIQCSSITPDGSDFTITGPDPVSVIGATGNCIAGRSTIIYLKLATAVTRKGIYTVTFKAGTDGTPLIDECGLDLPVHSRDFTAYDTVSAYYSFTAKLGCKVNKLNFDHNGLHDVNEWTWLFNNNTIAYTQQTSTFFPASGTNAIQLAVSNGVCKDTIINILKFDNEVKASFEIPDYLCPEDELVIKNTSIGQIDNWNWSLGFNNLSSNLKTPDPFLYPAPNVEKIYQLKVIATNYAMNCSDSITKKLTVLNNCYIAVPTAFTPNNDGLNDYLTPNNAIKGEQLDFKVFNRWGQQVFRTSDWRAKWDGKVNGIPQAAGVYVWYLSYQLPGNKTRTFEKGTTTLIR